MATIDPVTGLPVQNTTTAISTNQLKPVTPLNVTTPQVDTSLYTTGLNSALSDLQNGVDTQQALVDTQNKQAMNQNSAIANLQAQAGGKAQDITSTYQDTGVTNLFNQLKDINAQAQGLNLEAQAIPIQTQQEYTGRLATQAGTSAIDAGKLRENALKALSLGQQAAIASANYDKAKNYADQLVEAKYAGLEAEIKAKQTNLDGLDKYVLTPAQQKLKDSQAVLLKRQEQELADKKANEKAVNALMVNAQVQDVPRSIYEKAKIVQANGGTEAEVAAVLGVYSGDYLSTRIKKAQLDKLGLENRKALNELYDNPNGIKYLSYEENAKFNSTPEAKAIKDATGYAKAISDYKSAINTYGTGEMFGAGSGALGQAYSALVGATKDYYTLGTLDNGVQKLIALGIPEPSVMGLKTGRIDALDTALNGAADTIKRNSDQLLATRYKNTNELKQLIDNAGSVLMYKMSNQELLDSIPSQDGSNKTAGSTNNFFDK